VNLYICRDLGIPSIQAFWHASLTHLRSSVSPHLSCRRVHELNSGNSQWHMYVASHRKNSNHASPHRLAVQN
jgi:hypothetical protein